MFAERVGYIIWLSDWKAARGLDKYGTLHYLSRKMQYAVLYMNADTADDVLRNVQRLPYVRRVERSYRSEIKTEYEKKASEQPRYYGL